MHVAAYRLLLTSALVLSSGVAAVAAASNLADDPRYYRKDPREVVITDIGAWSHPTKQVFERHHLDLTKAELMWNKTFPVFHVTSFGADPGASPADPFFTSLELELLKANGYHAFKIVEDDHHDGFVVAYDRRTHTIDRELVQDESS